MISEETIKGQESWQIETGQVDLRVTKTGGHVAPVTFLRDTATPVKPYFVAPWGEDNDGTLEPIIEILRGNFFCLPFGGGSVSGGKKYITHGETANNQWQLERRDLSAGIHRIDLSLNTEAPRGKVEKSIALKEGQNVIYTKHILKGYAGRFPLGYHATLDLPEEPGSVRVYKKRGYTAFTPSAGDLFAGNDYYSLKPDQKIDDLSRVETIWKDPSHTDCCLYPQRKGYSDILQVFDADKSGPAWTIALVPSRGYLWFSLKNADVLPSTMFWISNGGRKWYPWNGSNRCLGLEDVCGFFASGAASSVSANRLTAEGRETARNLEDIGENSLNYIEGVAPIPPGFTSVEEVELEEGRLIVTGPGTETVMVPVDWNFLTTGEVGALSQSK